MLFTGALAGDIADAVTYTANWTLLDGSLDDLGEYVISGLVQSAGTGLAVNVTSGVASIGGRVTKGVSFIIGSLTPSNTNHLYLNQDGTATSNTTGIQPALSVKLGTATTDGAGVTSVATNWASGRQTRRRTEELVHGSGAGFPRAVSLASWHATNNEGNETKGTLPAGALPANVFLKDMNPQTLSDGVNIAVGAGSGTIIGTATSQKLGFFAAAPVAQISGSTDVLAGLVTLGLRAASSNPPFNIGTGALTAGSLACATISDTLTDSATSIESDMMTLTHHSSATPAAGFGTAIEFGGDDNANVNRKMGRVVANWLDASTALSISQIVLKAAKGASFVTALTADGNQLVSVPGTLAVNGGSQTILLTDAATSTFPTLLSLRHRTSGTPVAGFGSTLDFEADNASNALTVTNTISATLTDGTAGAEKSALVFKMIYSGTLAETMRIRAAGMTPSGGFGGELLCSGDFKHTGQKFGAFSATTVVQQTGASAAGIAAIADASAKAAVTALQNALNALGFVTAPA